MTTNTLIELHRAIAHAENCIAWATTALTTGNDPHHIHTNSADGTLTEDDKLQTAEYLVELREELAEQLLALDEERAFVRSLGRRHDNGEGWESDSIYGVPDEDGR